MTACEFALGCHGTPESRHTLVLIRTEWPPVLGGPPWALFWANMFKEQHHKGVRGRTERCEHTHSRGAGNLRWQPGYVAREKTAGAVSPES